jgi:diguanylate cyclase (GGDEF)-like protein/PAS domain S-box-containing protein
MRRVSPIRSFWTKHTSEGSSWLLTHLSYYWVPAIIAVASAIILVSQKNLYETENYAPLSFRFALDQAGTLNPSEALKRIEARPWVEHLDTHRSESPYWILLPLSRASSKQTIVELASRHAREVTCWSGEDLQRLGSADRYQTSGAMRVAKAGFAIDLSSLASRPRSLLCRTTHTGPARITVNAWAPSELARDEYEFHRGGGLLEGGLLVLALFTVVMAVINREARYMLLAVWLVGNLRLAAISIGWDTQWLGYKIPPDWVPLTRKITIALYYLVTYTLFSEFLKADLSRASYDWLLKAGQLSVILLIMALALPFKQFLPIMWVIVTFGIGVMIFFLMRILIFQRSRTAIWFGCALGMVLLASFSEVLAAALDFKFLVTAFNSVTAAMASSLLVALALAERMRAEREERVRTQEALSRTYESTPVGLFTLDAEGRFLRANTAMQSILKLGGRDPAGQRWQDHFEPNAWDTLQRIAMQSDGGEAELRGLSRGGGEAPWLLVRAIHTGDYIEGSLQDITERIEATEKLRFLANHDLLTGALNRHGIEGVLDAAVPIVARDRPLMVAYLDMDRFKLVNDLYRNKAGDEVLKQISQRVRETLGPDHFLGRLGGDEFLVVMRDTPMIAATRIGRKILQVLNEEPYHFGNQTFQLQVSMGLIEVTPHMRSADAISTAERACREAKTTNQGPLVVYERDAAAFQERAEELELIKALGDKHLPAGLYLVMQPILSLRRPDDSLNFEILLRMRDAAGNEVPVGKLLDAAEASGNIARVDKWVLTQTLKWLDRNLSKLPKTRFVSVNFSGASLNDQTFIKDVFAILRRYESVVPHVCIEITEGVALNDLEHISQFIDRVKESGASIALDDFGAGYTSFSYLRNLQADVLKIDGSFVQSINRHPANVAIVAAIVELARNLGMRSIAEGVETAEMLETLAEIGTDYVQGYVVARPQPLDTLLAVGAAINYIEDSEIAALVRRLAEEGSSLGMMGPAHYH